MYCDTQAKVKEMLSHFGQWTSEELVRFLKKMEKKTSIFMGGKRRQCVFVLFISLLIWLPLQ